MLIINADDWGRNPKATDTALECYQKGRISSTTAMVFMEDSERGAQLALQAGIDVGLHLNFTEEFSDAKCPPEVRRSHDRVRKFLRSSKYALLFYHPFLRSAFALIVQAQFEEFDRLFGRSPSHVDGHQHMHLCTNVLLGKLIPFETKVRRSFSFLPGEKSPFNRTYRSLVDRFLKRRYRTPDFFYALSSHLPLSDACPVFNRAKESVVELMNHPEVDRECQALLSDEFAARIEPVELGTYSNL